METGFRRLNLTVLAFNRGLPLGTRMVGGW